jgi:hypothetical protein
VSSKSDEITSNAMTYGAVMFASPHRDRKILQPHFEAAPRSSTLLEMLCLDRMRPVVELDDAGEASEESYCGE